MLIKGRPLTQIVLILSEPFKSLKAPSPPKTMLDSVDKMLLRVKTAEYRQAYITVTQHCTGEGGS